MNPYFVVADVIMAWGFTVVAGLAGYRHFKQGGADPALHHLLPQMVACLVAAVCCLVRNWFPPAAIIEAIAIGALSWVLGRSMPAMIAQPTMTEIHAILRRFSKVESKVEEILDHVTEESNR